MQHTKVIFHLHIPKSGGTTLNQWIYRYARAGEYVDASELLFYSGVYWYPGRIPPYGFFKDCDSQPPAAALDVLGRPDLRAVLGHFAYGIHRYIDRPTTYVTLLRDPIDRIPSLYNHLQPKVSLEQFVRNYVIPGYDADQTRLITDNDQTRRIAGLEPPFRRCTAEILNIAKENLQRDFAIVGVTERFDDVLGLMLRTFGSSGTIEYQKARVSRKRLNLKGITAHTLDLIRERNALDIESHQFAGELLDLQLRDRLGAAPADGG